MKTLACLGTVAITLTLGCGDATTTGASIDVGGAEADGTAGADGSAAADSVRPDGGAPDLSTPADSGAADPGAVDPGAADPGTADPGSTDPGPGDPGPEGVDTVGAGDDPTDPGPFTWQSSSASISVDGGMLPATVELVVLTPDGAGPFPAVVVSHGFQLGPGDYASYGEHLASWGFIAVLPAYPGSIIVPRTHVQLQGDLQAVLDWLEAEHAPTAIGLAGHSMGGKISLLVAAHDSRPAAVFGIDAVDAAPPMTFDPTAYPSVTPELMPQIDVPLALLGETTDATGGMGGACAPAEDNFHQYFLHAASPAVEIEVLGANHMSFLDDPDCGLPCLACQASSDDPTTTRALTRRYLAAFFLAELTGEASYRAWLTGQPMADDVAAGLVTFATANGYP